MPGVSIKIICVVFRLLIAYILDLVVCDLFAVIETFFSRNLFKKVDLPTLVLPIMVTSPHLLGN